MKGTQAIAVRPRVLPAALQRLASALAGREARSKASLELFLSAKAQLPGLAWLGNASAGLIAWSGSRGYHANRARYPKSHLLGAHTAASTGFGQLSCSTVCGPAATGGLFGVQGTVAKRGFWVSCGLVNLLWFASGEVTANDGDGHYARGPFICGSVGLGPWLGFTLTLYHPAFGLITKRLRRPADAVQRVTSRAAAPAHALARRVRQLLGRTVRTRRPSSTVVIPLHPVDRRRWRPANPAERLRAA